MKVWALTEEFKEGKYLVVRRDGTVPEWPHFVMSARDPAAPEALRSYANRCASLKLDRDYRDSIWDLARLFEDYGRDHAAGDPDAGPHRIDNAFVIACMRHENDLTGLTSAPALRPDIEYLAALSKIEQLASRTLEPGDMTDPAAPLIVLAAIFENIRAILQTAQDAQRAPEPVATERKEAAPPERPDSGLSV